MFLKVGVILAVALAAAVAKPQHQQQQRYVAPAAQQQYRLVAQPQAQAQSQPQYQAQAQPQYQAQAQPQYQAQAQPQYQAQPQAYYQAQPQAEAQPQPQLARLRPGAAQQPALQSQYQPAPEDYDPNPQYQFSFDVKDDEFTNYQNRKEQREGGKISGSYSVVDSDGFIRTVKYTADPLEGFKAEVTREPTNIVVKIPTPPAPAPAGNLRHQQTQQYLQGTIQGVQPPQSQVFTTLGQLPKRLPHVAAAAPAPAPAAPSGPRYSAAAAAQYSAAPAAPAAFAPAQYQPQYLSAATGGAPVAAAPRPKPIKAGAIGFATQPSGSVVYQAYQQ